MYRCNYLELTWSSGRVAPPTQIWTAEHRYHFVLLCCLTCVREFNRTYSFKMCVCVSEKGNLGNKCSTENCRIEEQTKTELCWTMCLIYSDHLSRGVFILSIICEAFQKTNKKDNIPFPFSFCLSVHFSGVPWVPPPPPESVPFLLPSINPSPPPPWHRAWTSHYCICFMRTSV